MTLIRLGGTFYGMVWAFESTAVKYNFSPTHKRTEGRAPVWGSEFTSKRRHTTGGGSAETAARLNIKLRDLTDRPAVIF
jgi:hypothetical protein